MAEASDKLLGLLPELGIELASVVARLRQSVVVVRPRGGGVGSGVVWHDGGNDLVVTNHHVLTADSAELVLADGRVIAARVVARDEARDLAALRVAVDLPPVLSRASRDLRLGELVLAVGNPLGLRGAVTVGIISGLGPVRLDGRQWRNLVRADVELLPGNSGGPLADVTGRIVGLNAMVAGPGIALAVPSDEVVRFVEEVVGRGTPREWL